MSTTQSSKTRDEPEQIENYKAVMNCLGRITALQPDGSHERAIIDNPRNADPYEIPPDYLRVSLPRKGTSNFTVIEKAGEMGLVVGDVWQMDTDKDNDRLYIKLVKKTEL